MSDVEGSLSRSSGTNFKRKSILDSQRSLADRKSLKKTTTRNWRDSPSLLFFVKNLSGTMKRRTKLPSLFLKKSDNNPTKRRLLSDSVPSLNTPVAVQKRCTIVPPRKNLEIRGKNTVMHNKYYFLLLANGLILERRLLEMTLYRTLLIDKEFSWTEMKLFCVVVSKIKPIFELWILFPSGSTHHRSLFRFYV